MTPERSNAMFGVDNVEAWYKHNAPADLQEDKILAMSVLSDAQELIVRGEDDRARQLINLAKWMIRNKL